MVSTPSVMVLPVSREELADLVRAGVADAMASAATAQRPELVDAAELARALSCSLSTVRRLARDGAPCVRVGLSPRYSVSAVVSWLQGREVAR